jgi:hypothetical protein
VFKITTERIEELRARVNPNTHPTLAMRSGTIRPARVVKRGKKKRLLSRAELDGRCVVAKVFDQLVTAIHADLGGRSELSAIELALVEAFAGAAVTLDHLNTRVLAGAEIDHALITMHAQAISAMVRVDARLGLARRSKPVMSTLGELIRREQEAERERLAREREAVL